MAAANVDVQGSKIIHVPPCDHRPCQKKLLQLVDKFRDAGVLCEYKYRPLGLYVDSFKKFIKTYPCTILHVCPMFYKKLTQALDVSVLLKEFANQIMCVTFQQSESNAPHNENDTACDIFFANFSLSDVSSEVAITEFVNEVKSITQAFTDCKPEKCEVSPYYVKPPQEDVDTYSEADDEGYINNTIKGIDGTQLQGASTRQEQHSMEAVSDMFGQTRGQEVFARTDWLQVQSDKMTPTALDTSEVWSFCCNAAKDDTDPKTRQARVYFVLKKFIPELYNSKQAQALANIVVKGQPELPTHAITMLELLLLEGHAARNRNCLVTIEHNLTEYLDLHSNVSLTDEQDSGLLKQRVSNLLLMLQYEIAIHCQGAQKTPRPGNSIRSTIRDRSKFQKGTSNADLYQKTAQQLLEVVNEFCKLNLEEDPYPRAKKLLDRSKASQVAVVFQHLKEIFSTMNTRSLISLKDYVNCKKVPPNECLSMIVLGLTLFLCHGLSKASARNIKEVSAAVVDVLRAASLKNLQHGQVNSMQVMLMFDKTPVIRQGIIEYFKMKHVYPSDIEELLMTEIKRLLCPFLVVDTKRSVATHYLNWGAVRGSFSGTPVIIFCHIPQEKDHEMNNETQFINFADTMHTNQIKKLLTLQHELVICLFAYQLTSIPQFYILQDYVTNNLQVALKNRNDNRRYFDYLTLMRFLSCAVEALEYCHSKDIVHRNLTADSLFIVAEYTVKLGGFTLAIDMDHHTELTALSGSSQIPTRWSAPESLSRLKYSKPSDVYMIGPLTYETGTHGALPYSHMSLSDDAFVEQVTRNKISLCHERCMKKEVYEEMCKCMAFDPADRPDVSTVRKAFDNLCKDACGDYKPRFPSLSQTPTAHEREPSTIFAKGSPEYESYTGKPYIQPLKNISPEQGFQQYQMGDGYLFREDVKRQMSPVMLDQFDEYSSYTGVIPQNMKMHSSDEDILTFEYYIPSLQVLNILHYVSPLHTYLTAVLKVAETLDILHRSSIVLGDLSTSSVFVELNNDSGTDKVHIVSWAHLNCTQTYSDRPTQTDFSKGDPVLTRAAPEVAESGLYTPASDVYCFGQFLKQIAAYLYGSFNHYTSASLTTEQTDKWDQCYKLLMQTAHKCMACDRRDRLPLANVMERIKMIITYLRPNCAAQQDSSYELCLPADLGSGASHRCRSRSVSTNYGRNVQPRRTNSETTVKKFIHYDVDDEVIPKQILVRRHSADSGMLSIGDSNTSIKETHHIEQKTSFYSFAKLCEEADTNIADTDSDIYIDTISSRKDVNDIYTNVPKPQTLPDDSEIYYTEPAEFPPGYRYLQTRSHGPSHHQSIQGDRDENAAQEPIYIDIENVQLSTSADDHVRILCEISNGNDVASGYNEQLVVGAHTASGDQSSGRGFCDLPDASLDYQRLPNAEQQDDSGDTYHDYQSLAFPPPEDECEVWV